MSADFKERVLQEQRASTPPPQVFFQHRRAGDFAPIRWACRSDARLGLSESHD